MTPKTPDLFLRRNLASNKLKGKDRIELLREKFKENWKIQMQMSHCKKRLGFKFVKIMSRMRKKKESLFRDNRILG